jgi:hypothetical protein
MSSLSTLRRASLPDPIGALEVEVVVEPEEDAAKDDDIFLLA